MGCDVLSFEIANDVNQDVLSHDFLNFVSNERNNIKSIMLPVPCRTFSLAQSRGGKAIRSQAYPRGLPGPHSESALERIRVGNSIVDRAVRLLRVLNKLHIPYIVENPYSSYLWHFASFSECLRGGAKVRVHQCAFGAPYRKDTLLVFMTW